MRNYCSDQRANKFCNAVVRVVETTCGDHVRAIVLFGSHARGDASPVSDVDLLIILADSPDVSVLQGALSRKVRYLEEILDLMPPVRSVVDRMLRAVKMQTGMFRSWFVCSEKDLHALDFARAFGVNQCLSRVVSPSTLVYLNLKREGVVIWGDKDVLSPLKLTKWRYPLIRSFVLTFVESLGSLALTPFSAETTLFSMEAVKWSAFNLQFIAAHFGVPLPSLVEMTGMSRYFIARKNYNRDPVFNLLAVWLVWRIHSVASGLLRSISSPQTS